MADKQKPDQLGTKQARMAPAVKICRDVSGGTLVLRKLGTEYLPRFERERPDEYSRRLSTAVLFNMFGRAVKAFVGMVLRKPLAIDNVPDEILEHLKDVDREGRDLDTFAADAMRDELHDGHRVIFVDMDPLPEGARSLKDVEGQRPFWVDIPHQSILRFTAADRGAPGLLQRFAYKFTKTLPEGEFGDVETIGVRDYELMAAADGEEAYVRFREWIKTPKKEEDGTDAWGEPTEGRLTGKMADEIPVAVCYAAREGEPLVSKPPMLDVAIENIKHYQARSDRDNHLHMLAGPTPWIAGGFDDDKIEYSSTRALRVPKGGSVGMLEVTGAGFDASREELQDIEGRVAALSIAMLQRDTRAAETAEAKRLDKGSEDASLSTTADGLESGLNEALRLHFKWLGQELGEAKISVNRDFERQLLDPATATHLLNAVVAGRLSTETYWDALDRGELLPPGFDKDAEKKRIIDEQDEEFRTAAAQPPAPEPGPEPNPDDE